MKPPIVTVYICNLRYMNPFMWINWSSQYAQNELRNAHKIHIKKEDNEKQKSKTQYAQNELRNAKLEGQTKEEVSN